MATFTTRLNATKPASSENVNVTVLNDNFDLFDGAAGATVGTSASRPASAFSGRLYYATDSAKLFVNSASTASAAASWQDSVANALTGAVSIGGDVAASGANNVSRSASSSNAYTATVHADAQKRFAVTAGGVVNWGSGAATADTNLYRDSANVLKTDDSLTVGGGVTSVGTVTASTTLNVGGAATLSGGVTVTGKGEKTMKRKSTSTGRASTTTLADDPHITFTLAASAMYRLEAHYWVDGASAADVKFAWSFTGAASGAGSALEKACVGPPATTTDALDTNVRSTWHLWTTAVAFGLDGVNDIYASDIGLINNTGGGSGTMTLQWAQNTSNATSTVVGSNTWALLERLT